MSSVCTTLKREEESNMGEILNFKGVGDNDVYNSTGPFRVNGASYLAARVEKRDVLWKDEGYSPKIMFFKKSKNVWQLAEDAPVLEMMEDPFKTYIDGDLILGGVEVSQNDNRFRTVFFRGKCPWSLRRFASGPEMMKDIRLVELSDKRIGVFTRPQGKKHKKGRIGFTIIDCLEDLNKGNIEKADIINDNLRDNQWEGVNDAKLLKSGKVGVLSHIAQIDKNSKKTYEAEAFTLCPKVRRISKRKIVAKRSDFPNTPVKMPTIKDVIFPGEITINYLLYTGVSDTSEGRKQIENPYDEPFYHMEP